MEYAISSEFGIHTALADLPLTGCPTYLTASVGGACLSGSATITVFNTRFNIRPGMIVILLPWQLASIGNISDDFRFTFFRISETMFTDTLCSMWRFTPDFFFYMSRHISSRVLEDNASRFLGFCEYLKHRAEFAPELCRRESVMQLLRVFYWDHYAHYISDPELHTINLSHYTRKEELAYRFLRLILEDHSPDKDVSYYAAKLNVSAKYLTTLIRNLSGHSARDWIVGIMIIEIKSLLRESALDLKSIANRLHFPDQSTMSRSFAITPE